MELKIMNFIYVDPKQPLGTGKNQAPPMTFDDWVELGVSPLGAPFYP
jgi:hypothetical protein